LARKKLFGQNKKHILNNSLIIVNSFAPSADSLSCTPSIRTSGAEVPAVLYFLVFIKAPYLPKLTNKRKRQPQFIGVYNSQAAFG